MYCKNCGAQNNDDARFCTSCGAQIEEAPTQNEYKDYFDEPVKQNQYDYDDSNQTDFHNQQPSNIYGKQFEAHAQGNVSYGNKRRSPVSKLLGFVVIVGLIAFAYFMFFANNGPIYDVVVGIEVNQETFYPDEPLEGVIESNGILYFSYSTRDIQYETINVTMMDVDNNYNVIYSDNIYVEFEESVGYFSYSHNWTPGEYEIDFEVDGEVVYTFFFDVIADE